MAGIGFNGQNSDIKSGKVVESISKKILDLIDSKSADITSYINSKSGEDGMSEADQQKAIDQGKQDFADNIALAVFEGLKEGNAAIVSNTIEDSAFWKFQTEVALQLQAIKIVFTTLSNTLPAAGAASPPLAGGVAGFTALKVALDTALATLQPPSAPSELKSHMEP